MARRREGKGQRANKEAGGRRSRRAASFHKKNSWSRPSAAAPVSAQLIEGKLQHHGRFGFVVPDSGDGDFYVSGSGLRLAMDGDRVAVRPISSRGSGGKREAAIVSVVKRGKTSVVGRLKALPGRRWAVEPDEGEAVRVLSLAKNLQPKEGALVVLKITEWPSLAKPAGGSVEEILGDASSPRVRATAALRSRELPDHFPEAVLAETAPFPEKVMPSMWRGRRELFDLPLFTIDGADAKDFDDAVSLEDLGSGKSRLGVHIADVSTYVKPGTAIDREAYERATSVYLPGRVVPMLPPKLCDHLCSLMPRVERLALSCFLEIDSQGKVLSSRFEETVIRSWHRFTYNEAELILLGQKPKSIPDLAVESVLRMGVLAKKLTALRFGRGALDIDMPEYKIEVDAQGSPVSVERREHLDSHRLIEEFMILANEAAARFAIAQKQPAPHRIHPDPDPRKLGELARELEALKAIVPPSLGKGDPRALQGVLKAAKSHPLGDTIGILTVRSLKQAVYSAEPGPHFGLASAAYAHFTSPIRRYPDLLLHRAIKAALGKGGAAPKIDMAEASRHCSEKERLAAEAEREAVEVLRIAYLAQGLSRDLTGKVTRQLPYGALVCLDETGAVGLVRNLKGTLGQAVRVRVLRVDVASRQLDLVRA